MIHLNCQHVIFNTFKPRVKHLYSLFGEGDLGRNQMTHPDTAGECMKIPQWEQRMRDDKRQVRVKKEKKNNPLGKYLGKVFKLAFYDHLFDILDGTEL